MEKETNDYSVEVFELSQHLPIDIKPLIGRKWVLNGENNGNYIMVKDAYDDSTTNAAIINSYINYIYADGLIDEAATNIYGEDGKLIADIQKTSISKYLSKSDARLVAQDYKTYGAYSVQVIWNSAINKADKRPIQIKYIPVFKLALNVDKQMKTTGYWYSFDWQEKNRYKPVLTPMYTGIYTGNDVEIMMIQRPSSNPFFAQPDYISCIRYCQLEGELGNSAYAHVKNGFQGTKVVNCNNGIPATEELKAEYKRQIISKLTGTNNTNKVIISFNKSADLGTTVTDIPVPELNQQYVHFEETAERKIIVGHQAPAAIFSSERSGGLGNNAEEIKTATQMLYRKIINPMREVIIDGLMTIFKNIDPGIRLEFRDFTELDTVAPVSGAVPVTYADQTGFKISLDFDGTANTPKGKERIAKYIKEGKHVYLISARDSDIALKAFAEANGISPSRVFATGSNKAKVEKVKSLGIQEHIDNNPDVVKELGTLGKLFK